VKRVLIVAYYFPPVAATGAMRPLGFCRYLSTYGWTPHVVTTTPDSVYPVHSVDERLSGKLPSSIKVEAIPYASTLDRLLHFRKLIRDRIGRRGNHAIAAGVNYGSNVKTNELKNSGHIGQLKRFVLDRMFAFPDPQSAWMEPVLKHVGSLAKDEQPDLVFATGSPWTSLAIARKLGRRFRVPFIVDFRDPWASNAGFHYISPQLIRKTEMLERQICQEAAAVIANTSELRTHLTALYPEIQDKCVAIPNGFHADDFALPATPDGDQASQRVGIELCHFGTMYMMRTPVELLRALLELVEEGTIRKAQLRLRFIGTWDVRSDECERMAQGLEKHGVLLREPPVSHQECLRQMARADALLTMQPGSTLQIPAKIYEYIATRRPLVVIGDPGATFNLVQRHRLGVCCSNQAPAIKQLFTDLIFDSAKFVTPSEDATALFDYKNLTGQLAKVFDGASGRT
jgi:hypothetical protein